MSTITFEENFAKAFHVKARHLYFGDRILEELDVDTFQILNHHFIKDNKSVIFTKPSKNKWFTFHVLEGADAASIELLGHDAYAKDENYIYYCNHIIIEADNNSFQSLGEGYAKDKYSLFYLGRRIDFAGDLENIEILSYNYLKDRKYVYYNFDKIPQAIAESFYLLQDQALSDGNSYAKDHNYVYYEGQVIQNADPNTFEILDSYYSKDKYHIFYASDILSEADVKTFQLLPYVVGTMADYAKDQNHAFFRNKVLQVSDLSSFQSIKHKHPYALARDKKHFYKNGIKQENILAGLKFSLFF